MNTFQLRLNYAARVIREGRNTSRRFDGCFEEGDGDEMVAALVRRSRRNTRLHQNLPRYIAQTSIDACQAPA